MPERGWPRHEVELAVADYFAMLRKSISGEPYSKTEHRRALRQLIPARTEASLENKHRNISAILMEEKLTWIPGYKPLRHYQGLLRDVVVEAIDASPWLITEMETNAAELPKLDNMVEYARVARLVEPPAFVAREEAPDYAWAPSMAKHRDFPGRDASNRKLGKMGEELIFEWERSRLREAGRADLSSVVRWTARDDGDGAGYDIESFTELGEKTFLEVKTTNDHNPRFPFIVSRNEVACSEALGRSFRLVRVYAFSREPRFYQRDGAIRKSFNLDPLNFRAVP
jgi:hypothetical protein